MGLSASIKKDDWVAIRRAVQNIELRLSKVQSLEFEGLKIDSLSGVLKATAGVVSGSATHNILASLQGGTTDEYYHLTSAEHSALHPAYTDEMAQDAVGTILANSDTINLTYVDGTPAITADLSFLGIESLIDPGADNLMGWDDTDGAVKFITVGANLTYTHATHTLSATGGGGYTDEEAQDAVGIILVDSASIDFTYTDATPEITAVVLPAGVDHNSLNNVHQDVNTTASPEFVDVKVTESAYFDAEYDNGNSGAADTIDWTAGNKQKSTLTADCEYTFGAPGGPCNLILKVTQDGTGGWVVTWPATVKWPLATPPVLSTTAGAVDIIAFYYDGTNYYGSAQTSFGTGGTTEQKDYLLYRDVKVAGTDGGTFTSGAWRTRDLTEETIDTGNRGSLAANQITLVAGTYECDISAPAYYVSLHQIRLYNVTDAAIITYGTSESATTSGAWAWSNRSFIKYRFTITASKVIRVEHRCSVTRANLGFGVANNFGGDEVYTIAQFWKIN